MSTSEIEFSRQIRAGILRTLYAHAQSGLAIGYCAGDLTGLLAGSVFGRDERLLASEITELEEVGQIRRLAGEDPPRWVIAALGKDFVRANFPWSAADKFSGCHK